MPLTSQEIRDIGEKYLAKNKKTKNSWWNCGGLFSRHHHHHLANEMRNFYPIAEESSYLNWQNLINIYSRLNKPHGDLASAIARLFNRDFPGKMPFTHPNVPAPVLIEYAPAQIAKEMQAIVNSRYSPRVLNKA